MNRNLRNISSLVFAIGTFPASAQLCSPASTLAVHLEEVANYPNYPISDTEIAVGDSRVLTCTNSWLYLHDKAANQIGTQCRLGDYNSPGTPYFFPETTVSPTVTFLIGDPVVYYDYEDDRFWVVAIEWGLFQTQLVVSRVQIGVSTDATPSNWDAINGPNGVSTGDWYKYDFTAWDLNIQPSPLHGLGHNQNITVDDDTLYIAFMDDEGTTDRSTTLCMIDKDKLQTGTVSVVTGTTNIVSSELSFLQLKDNVQSWGTESTYGHVVAVEYDAWNNSHPIYTIATEKKPNYAPGPIGIQHYQDTLILGAITKSGTPGSYTFSYVSTPITGGNLPDWWDTDAIAASPVPGPMILIASKFNHATYRPDASVGGRLWATHHVRPVAGPSDPSPLDKNIVRWYEIHTNGWPMTPSATPTLAQVGEIWPQDDEAFDPSIAVSSNGTVGLVWTQSGASTYPQFWMGAHLPTDSAGVLSITQMKQQNPYVRPTTQKADYSGIDPDPTNACVFWGHSPLATLVSPDIFWQSYLAQLCVNGADCDGYADTDSDSYLTSIDPAIFASMHSSHDPRADCNRDGVFDALDYLCYDQAYANQQ
ncbi:MAG: hypothetical protein H6815_12020 [Phycisphaeraceae bacterium]|nr:hypothetical protein [Phycisphaerales bacterium]MCB9861167.1 hypothetical protein [Phycisphaeraceae bacterium]